MEKYVIDQYASPEVSHKLKSIGFNDNCFAYYYDKTLILEIPSKFYTCKNSVYTDNCATAPLLQQAIAFLETKDIEVVPYFNASGCVYDINSVNGTHICWSEFDGPNDGGAWDTKKEATEHAILKAISILKEIS